MQSGADYRKSSAYTYIILLINIFCTDQHRLCDFSRHIKMTGALWFDKNHESSSKLLNLFRSDCYLKCNDFDIAVAITVVVLPLFVAKVSSICLRIYRFFLIFFLKIISTCFVHMLFLANVYEIKLQHPSSWPNSVPDTLIENANECGAT